MGNTTTKRNPKIGYAEGTAVATAVTFSISSLAAAIAALWHLARGIGSGAIIPDAASISWKMRQVFEFFVYGEILNWLEADLQVACLFGLAAVLALVAVLSGMTYFFIRKSES